MGTSAHQGGRSSAAPLHPAVLNAAPAKALLAALALFALFVWAPAARATTFTFSPTADARVKAASPSTNYGSLAYLATNACSCDRQEAYLRFNVSGLDGPVVSAVLRGRTYDSVDGPTSDGPAVYRTSGSWTESGLTWSNRPSATGAALDDLGALGRNATFNLRVTSAVTGNGSVDFLLRQAAGDSLYFYSREHGTAAARPQLIVTTAPAAPTPTPTPTATPPIPTPTATPPSPTATPAPVSGTYPLRGMYSRQSNGGYDKIVASGHNLIDSGPGQVSGLASGLKAMVWVGDYDDETCTWERSDAQIRSAVQAHIGDPKVGVWFIADEPWVGGSPRCPTTPSQMKARTDLIHSIDPSAKTLMVIDANSAEESLDQLPLWKGTVDYVGIDAYVCWQGQSCHYEWIDTLARAADAAGLDYWGVVQTFGDPSGQGAYMCTTTSGCGRPRLPTAGEIHEQFVHWRATRMSSYLSFAWDWPSGTPSLWLENHPELQLQLAQENAAAAGGAAS